MREAAAGVRVLALAAIGFSIHTFWLTGAWAQNQPGHSIAEKFSAEADRPAKEAAAKAAAAKKAAEAKQKAAAEKRLKEVQRKADEAEMLETAKAEADARRVALEAARADAEMAEKAAEDQKAAEAKAVEERQLAESKAAEAKRADDVRKAVEAKAAEERRIADQKADIERKAAELKHAEERRIAEARRIEEASKIAEAKVLEDRRAAEAKASEAKAAADRKIAEERRVAEAKASEGRRAAEASQAEAQAQARSQAMAAERDTEAQRVLERLKQAREQREAQDRRTVTAELPKQEPAVPQAPAGLGGPTPSLGAPSYGTHRLHSGGADVQFPQLSSGATRVTVLLLMEPGNRGIRRHNKTADPLLCNGGGCFVSNGTDAPATFLPGRRALGIRSTFGPRAGACSNSLGCVFRGIEIGALPAAIQPIDMRVMRHDRREPQNITAPADCHATAGRLACRRTIQSTNYVMWVVPEDIANQAGAAGLERALAEGLPDSEHAALQGPHPGR